MTNRGRYGIKKKEVERKRGRSAANLSETDERRKVREGRKKFNTFFENERTERRGFL